MTTAPKDAKAAAKATRRNLRRYNCNSMGIGGPMIADGEVLTGKSMVRHDPNQCDATIEEGQPDPGRITAARVVGGTLLLGPVGTVAGVLAKKRGASGTYLTLVSPEGAHVHEVKPKHATSARAFVANLQALKGQ